MRKSRFLFSATHAIAHAVGTKQLIWNAADVVEAFQHVASRHYGYSGARKQDINTKKRLIEEKMYTRVLGGHLSVPINICLARAQKIGNRL